MARKNKDPKLTAVDKKMGARWRKYREAKKFTLRQVAEMMRKRQYFCHATTISRVETGRSQPDHFQTFLMLACDIYNISPNQLFGAENGQGEPNGQEQG